MDDPGYVLQNRHIRQFSFKNLTAIFTRRDVSLYTPLSTWSFTFDYALGGLNPAVYHISNVTLHAANTLLVLFLGLSLGLTLGGAAIAAALFGIHPLHVESVAWIAERKDVLYGFFYLSALLAYLRFLRGGAAKFYAAALACFTLSCLAKPMAVTLPAVMLLCDWYLNGTASVRRNLKAAVPFFAIAAVFAAISAVPALTGSAADTVTVGISGINRLFAPFYAWTWYVQKTLLPANLSGMYITEAALPFLPAYALTGALIMACLALFARANRVVIFGAAFFTLAIAPVLQFIPFGPVLTADRYAYIPALGLFLPAAVYLSKRQTGLLLATLLTALLALLSANRSMVWRDNLTFWSDTIAKTPPNALVYSNTGVALLDSHNYQEAASLFSAAARLDPKNPLHLVNLAGAHFNQGRYAEAFDLLKQAEKLAPACPAALYNLGRMHGLRGDYAAARAYFSALLANEQYREPAQAGIALVTAKEAEHTRPPR